MYGSKDKQRAILFLTNKTHKNIICAFRDLKKSASNISDVFMIYHHTHSELPPIILEHQAFVFRDSILTEMNYVAINDKLIPGSNHFALLDFYKKNPGYRYYWYVEDDVRFNGDWKTFFSFFENNESDFISSHIRTYSDEPDWHWWSSIKYINVNIPVTRCLASFNPIFRISNDALEFIDQALSNGWMGHHEVLLPTLLNLGNYKIEDFGGNGGFVNKGQKEMFYSVADISSKKLSSMRFRPVIELEEMTASLLYHPVKTKL